MSNRGLALLFLGLAAAAAFADDRGRGRYGDWNPGTRGEYGYRPAGIVGRAMQNLRFAASRNRVDSHERNHFHRAMYHLQRFGADYARGHFERGHLNGAIDHMQDLARAHRIHPRDRQLIARDLWALRDLRSDRW